MVKCEWKDQVHEFTWVCFEWNFVDINDHEKVNFGHNIMINVD